MPIQGHGHITLMLPTRSLQMFTCRILLAEYQPVLALQARRKVSFMLLNSVRLVPLCKKKLNCRQGYKRAECLRVLLCHRQMSTQSSLPMRCSPSALNTTQLRRLACSEQLNRPQLPTRRPARNLSMHHSKPSPLRLP